MKITAGTLCIISGLLTISNALFIPPHPVHVTAAPTEVILDDIEQNDKSIFTSVIRAKLNFCSFPGMACMGKRDTLPLDTITTNEDTGTDHQERDLADTVHSAPQAREAEAEAEAQPNAQNSETWKPRVRVGKCSMPGQSCGN